MNRFYAIALPAVLLSSPAWSTVRIDASFDTIATEAQPENRQVSGKGGTTIILNNNGTVTKLMNGLVSANSMNGYVSSVTRDKRNSVSHYRVSNGSITELFENEGVRETISVSTNKESYCTAHVQFGPGRGQRYIVWNSGSQSFVCNEKAINVVCRIQKLN